MGTPPSLPVERPFHANLPQLHYSALYRIELQTQHSLCHSLHISGCKRPAECLSCRCEQGSGKALKVAVLLSGGVDSSLALHLLRQAGHSVTAFYLQIWFQEDFANFWGACPWEEDLKVCREVTFLFDLLHSNPLDWQRKRFMPTSFDQCLTAPL